MVPPIPIIRGHGLGCLVHNNALFMCKKIWDTLEKQPTGWWCNVPILKHDGVRQWGWDDIPYMTWKIKAMFESTNQIIAILIA
jgi:hypothetical protein